MKRTFYSVCAAVVAMILQFNMVFAYGSQQEGRLGSVTVRVSNEINVTKTEANAITWTSNQASSAYVSAEFYWVDYANENMSRTTRSFGNSGSAGVYGHGTESYDGQTVSVYYYQVISYHRASYGGATYTYPDLSIFVQ